MKITATAERSNAKGGHGKRNYERSHGHGSPIIFHGIDTEGVGSGSDHRPVLISCGSQWLAKESGLKWFEIFDFLYSNFKPGGHAYVGYYLSYDFTQWLKTLPEDRARMLLSEAGRAARTKILDNGTMYVFPVGCGKWEFDLLGHKRLKIRPKTCHGWERCPYPHTSRTDENGRSTGQHRWMYICDVGPFFQSSFLKAIHPSGWPEPIVSQDEYDLIAHGKEHLRGVDDFKPEMVTYQQAEISALEKLMNAQQSGLREMGVYLKPQQWFGPGQIAQELLKKWDMPGSRELPNFMPENFLHSAMATYYGGWFEIFAHGLVKEAWSYDINSAYPYVIANLPCLRHGKFSSGKGMPTVHDNSLCIVWASVRRKSDLSEWNPDNPGSVTVGSMLHRTKDGRIFRPLNTSGAYWLHEIQAAERAGCIEHITYHRWLRYDPCDCPPPLKEVAGLYEWRLKIGKNTPLGKALKLAYNSIYGKLAQSIGHPKYGNPIYASLITAGCRTMILDAIATHPKGQESVLMVATDGVYFLDRHPGLPISKKLGEWEEEHHTNLTLFKPGVYWDDKGRQSIRDGENPEFKARGVNVKDFAKNLDDIDAKFRSWPKRNLKTPQYTNPKGSGWPKVEVQSSFAMVSVLQALMRGKWESAGSVDSSPVMTQSSVHFQKRWGLFYDKERDIHRSIPRWDQGIMGNRNHCPPSQPYEKRFGIEDPWSDEMKQFAGVQPEGDVSEIIAAFLNLRG